MFDPDENGVFAIVQASGARRALACVVLFGLGGLLIWLALVQPPAPLLLVLLLVMGVAILFIAERLRRATTGRVELTAEGLRDENGLVLAHMDEIKSVERGVFALKPSNGFTLVLNARKPRHWAPGLWWRFGRRVGVGGVTAAGQTKFMAEQIALRLTDDPR